MRPCQLSARPVVAPSATLRGPMRATDRSRLRDQSRLVAISPVGRSRSSEFPSSFYPIFGSPNAGALNRRLVTVLALNRTSAEQSQSAARRVRRYGRPRGTRGSNPLQDQTAALLPLVQRSSGADAMHRLAGLLGSVTRRGLVSGTSCTPPTLAPVA